MDSSTTHLTLSHVVIQNSNPKIKYSLVIQHNLTCSLTIYGKTTQPNYATIKKKDDLLAILKVLENKTTVCIGNDDEKFMDLTMKKGGKLYNRAGKKNSLKVFMFTCIYLNR